MKKVKLLIIGFILLFGCQTAMIDQGVMVYDKVEHSVVRVGDTTGPAGSGFFYTDKGYVITCYHVVDELIQNRLVVQTKDEKLFMAELVGFSEVKDLAILKLVIKKDRKANIVPVTVTKKKNIKVGETVYMYGHPRGITWTLTKGIVGKIHQEFAGTGDGYKAIQSDAEMNFGNSGGILVDARGDLIGMTSAMYSEQGVGMGLNIAVHIEEIKKVIKLVLYNEKQGKNGISVDKETEKNDRVTDEKVLKLGK